MPRKRKVLVPVPEEESDNEGQGENALKVRNRPVPHGPMYMIMNNAQLNETYHNKYVKEMQQLYKKMDHDAFMFTFIKMIKSAMEAEETNEYAHTSLLFCAKYISSYNTDDTHPVLISIFDWLLSTISNNPHIRFRLCQFVNMILNALGVEAALDSNICFKIMGYMIDRLKDLNPNVRVQAILALQRLQVPDNPDDVVVKVYQFHLSSDPSSRVRQAVITSMGRNYNTIPYILERLWDIDEKVRRHTYLHMSSYPAKAYKVSQRLTFLEQGLNDRSDMVRKVVTTVMLPQWLESYNKDFIALISALKLDANETEIDRFRKITKMTLHQIFKRQKIDDLINNLPIEQEGEFIKCIPCDNLSMENSLYWLCLIEYLQNEEADELDLIIPELSVFCSYILRYCDASKTITDKWQKMEYQYILLTLMEIICTFDLGDEIGRENLKQLLGTLLKNYDIEERTVEVIIRCAENLITEQEERLQFFVAIIQELSYSNTWKSNDFTNDRTLIEELLEKQPDKSLKLKLSALKVKILDLEEQEMNFVEQKDYFKAQKIADEKNACREEYANLLKPLLSEMSSSDSADSRRSLSVSFQQAKKVTTETIIKSLQIAFHMIVSKKVKSLTPNVCELYKDFIRRHIESNQISVRDWALKCGAAYSMLYEQLAKDVYVELYSQFYKNHNIRIWKTSIDCIFELLDRYGFANFELEDKQNKSRKAGRQLYNTLEFLDGEEDTTTTGGYGVDLMFMMSHFLDTCDDVCIVSALVNGFCRLILHGRIKNDDIVEKLLLKYFNPATDTEINQILGVFFENLIARKKQEYLQRCLLPTISTILGAPYDSPLHEIKPETVLRFVIDATRPAFCSSGLNIHNTMALQFMKEMQNNSSNKELLRVLSKELVTLEVSVFDDVPLKNDLKASCEKLLQSELEPKTAKYINGFKDIVEGNVQVHMRSSAADGSDEENGEDVSEEEEDRRSKSNTNVDDSKKTKDTSDSQDARSNILLRQNTNKTRNASEDAEATAQNTENGEKAINGVGNSETIANDKENVEITETVENEEVIINVPEYGKTIENIEVTENVAGSAEVRQNSHQNTSNRKQIDHANKSADQLQSNTDVSEFEHNDVRDTTSEPNSLSATEKGNVVTAELSKSCNNENSKNTPIMVTLDNTSDLRHVRKSLNIRRTSYSDGPLRPPKIRIQAKTGPSSADSRTNNNDKTEIGNDKENSNNLENAAMREGQSNNNKELRKNKDNLTSVKSLIIGKASEDVGALPRRDAWKKQEMGDGKKDAHQDLEEIPPSPEANTIKKRGRGRPLRTDTIQRSVGDSRTHFEKSKVEENDENRNPAIRSKRRLILSPSRSNKSKSGEDDIGVVPLRKQLRKSTDISVSENNDEKTPEKSRSQHMYRKSNNNNSDSQKESKTRNKANKPSRIVLTESVEKKIRKSKNPILKLQKSEGNVSRPATRSATKKETRLNQIMTRKRLSLENISLRLESLTKSPEKNSQSPKREGLKRVRQIVSSQYNKKSQEPNKSKENTTNANKNLTKVSNGNKHSENHDSKKPESPVTRKVMTRSSKK